MLKSIAYDKLLTMSEAPIYKKYQKNEYTDDLFICVEILDTFSSNYRLATKLFPRKIKNETTVFYALLRYADELVDNPEKKMKHQTHANLEECIAEWTQIVSTQETYKAHPVLRACYFLFLQKEIPFSYIGDFFEAMKQDMHKKRYQTYQELEGYMWGSAGIVGHVMTYIVGYKNKEAFGYAKALGEAMQLTNFLRDIDEDFQDRNRIYLPREDMDIYNVKEDSIKNRKTNEDFKKLVIHYSERIEALYIKGNKGVPFLKKGGFCVLLASNIYSYNLEILKHNDYDSFKKVIRVSKTRKLIILIQTFFQFYFPRS